MNNNRKTDEYQLIFQNATEGIITLKLDGTITNANPRAIEILGVKEDKLKGKNISERIPGFGVTTEIAAASYNMTAYGQALKEYEYKLKDKNLAIKVSILKNDEVEGFMIMINDVTERARMQKLETELETQKRTDELRNNFLTMITHDLKQPLMPIMGYAGLVLEKTKDKESRTYLTSIQKSSQQLLDSINRILMMSRLEAGNLNYNIVMQDLKDAMLKALETKAINISIKGIRIIKKLETAQARQDVERITDVLANLIDNAIKFTKIKGKIEVSTWTDKNNAYASVKDYGQGIKKEDIPKLFKTFSQTEEGKEKGGTGIGLALSKRIVQDHGGDITVKSTYGKGAEFIVQLPLK